MVGFTEDSIQCFKILVGAQLKLFFFADLRRGSNSLNSDSDHCEILSLKYLIGSSNVPFEHILSLHSL